MTAPQIAIPLAAYGAAVRAAQEADARISDPALFATVAVRAAAPHIVTAAAQTFIGVRRTVSLIALSAGRYLVMGVVWSALVAFGSWKVCAAVAVLIAVEVILWVYTKRISRASRSNAETFLAELSGELDDDR